MQCIKSNSTTILVSLEAQTLSYQGITFPISSSKFGEGITEGSNMTPLGQFQVCEKFGAGDEMFSIYKGRRKQSVWLRDDNDLAEDMILSRILRLSGMEPENSNTYARYIYIHGTNDEEGIGEKKSIGCIRMKNEDVITLYNLVPLGTPVQISAS